VVVGSALPFGGGLSGRFGPRNQTKVVSLHLMLRLW
jgi:hypothetical protein